MKLKLNQLSTGISIFILMGINLSCNLIKEDATKIAELERENDSLELMVKHRDSLMNEVMETFYEIEKDLAFIKTQQNIISVSSGDNEMEDSRKEQIVNDVRELSNLLKKNKKEVDELNKKLKKSGLKVKSFQTRMDELITSLSTSNEEMVGLKTELEKKNFEVSVLNEQLTLVETEKEQQKQVIDEQNKDIKNYNKAWYTLGTEKELQEKGLLDKEGGFLGLGKTKSLSVDFKSEYFSEYDIRETKAFKIEAETAILISEHPSNSYEFVKQNERIAYLAINDIDEFYKFSKYVVLEIK